MKKKKSEKKEKYIKTSFNIQPNKYYISWGKPPEQVASKPVQKTGSRSTREQQPELKPDT